MRSWEQLHPEKIAITAQVLAGDTLTDVGLRVGRSLSTVGDCVHSVCQRRNPSWYYAEVIRLLGLHPAALHMQPSLAWLRTHRQRFGFGRAGGEHP